MHYPTTSWTRGRALTLTLALGCAPMVHAQTAPNVVVIMVDDMGYSDIGAFGGEIETPHLDALAANGIRYTRFYSTGRCTPSRASLLTGRYSHDVGVGHLNSDRGLPGYRGQIDSSAQTLPEALNPAGYDSYMVGKWHLSRALTTPNGSWPHQRGFLQFHGSLEGAKDYFSPRHMFNLTSTGTVAPITTFPPDYFYTEGISNRASSFILNADPNRPVFLYVAFYAPHFPLQAPRAKTDEYLNAGTYANGWDPIRQARLTRQVQMGLASPGAQLSPRHGSVPDWSTLSASKRAEMELRMAVYAAQVELMDIGVGRIVDALTTSGRLDDTLILFFSDNGGVSGGGYDGTGPAGSVGTPSAPTDTRYGNAWGNVSNAPFREFKSRNHEGGIASPLIAHWPNGIDASLAGSIDTTSRGHIIDILPTALAAANLTPAAGVEGQSLTPTFMPSGAFDNSRMMFWEHEGRRGVSNGQFKAVASGPGSAWELYDIVSDRNEQNNLASSPAHATVFGDLVSAWEGWATRTDVIPWPWSPQYQVTTPTGPPTPCTLLSHLKFDAPTYFNGDTVQDASPSGFDGTVDTRGDAANHSVPTGVPGLGNAFDFTDDIVDIDLASVIPVGSQPRSFAFWFNSDTASTSNRIIGYGNPNSPSGSVFVVTCQGSAANAQLALRVASSVLTFTPSTVATQFSTGEWVHAVCVVPDGATRLSQVRMYIDGVIANSAITSGSDRDLVTGASYFGVGMRGGSSPGGAQASFDYDGKVGDAQVYREALTGAEAVFLFQNPGVAITRCATNTTLGAGCNGVALAAQSLPQITRRWDLTGTVPATTSLAVMAIGFSSTSTPLDAVGAPGCGLFVQSQAVINLPLPLASPALRIAIPNDVSLAGLGIFSQLLAVVPGANGLGVSTSNGVEGRIGI